MSQASARSIPTRPLHLGAHGLRATVRPGRLFAVGDLFCEDTLLAGGFVDIPAGVGFSAPALLVFGRVVGRTRARGFAFEPQ